MELPEPAAELWARTNEAVREHLEQLTGGPSGMRLGGGTVLGAQWHHRLSFDKRLDATRSSSTPRNSQQAVQAGRSTKKAVGCPPFGKAIACSRST